MLESFKRRKLKKMQVLISPEIETEENEYIKKNYSTIISTAVVKRKCKYLKLNNIFERRKKNEGKVKFP